MHHTMHVCGGPLRLLSAKLDLLDVFESNMYSAGDQVQIIKQSQQTCVSTFTAVKQTLKPVKKWNWKLNRRTHSPAAQPWQSSKPPRSGSPLLYLPTRSGSVAGLSTYSSL